MLWGGTREAGRPDCDLFKLQNILDAKLLRFKDDVEDIALSSVKEADIENKKNTIAADWEDRELVFGEFKHRGPLVLKGESHAVACHPPCGQTQA